MDAIPNGTRGAFIPLLCAELGVLDQRVASLRRSRAIPLSDWQERAAGSADVHDLRMTPPARSWKRASRLLDIAGSTAGLAKTRKAVSSWICPHEISLDHLPHLIDTERAFPF